MKIIQIKKNDEIKELNLPNNIMTAGFFDGVHLGHQELIKKSRNIADNLSLPLIVMTFWPYPKQFYTEVPTPYPVLTTQNDKYEIFDQLGVDMVIEIEFNSQIQKMEPQIFVDKYIKAAHVTKFIAGLDFTYGKKDIANMDLLPNYARGDFSVEKVPFTQLNGTKVSSSKIRSEILKGNFQSAKKLLGRSYITKGKVVTGEQIGRTLGFPTANVENDDDYLIPKDGVYFTKVQLDENEFWGITSVGNKPTYNGNRKYIETYILDFNHNIYGKELNIEWVYFERPQKKFESEKELIQEIKNDELNVRRYIQTK
ncbi:bifunctional riboflavin kinase/FAD synthetase [Xylocopilactobacillus apis]|uniref:Riboflavin biosynthesis protein n=1 Tax=Xylocopilactobacillus apis TaxID=2932183 RepID=A0AAU9CQP5_9LACO|nr:bifunctional riboflavin kinase/FAD synthetase [Xylocopilactobacillus apis]BDR56257.1 riboflavin biosynthesis protein [Xylocopilactobacillus apis]